MALPYRAVSGTSWHQLPGPRSFGDFLRSDDGMLDIMLFALHRRINRRRVGVDFKSARHRRKYAHEGDALPMLWSCCGAR